MQKNVKFITCFPDDTYYTWQVHLWLESLRERGKSKDAIMLLFVPTNRKQNPKWQQIIDLYPEAEFHFIKERNKELNEYIRIYIPIIRSYCMWRFLKDNPKVGLENQIFFGDSDIIFNRNFNLNVLMEDDIVYVSDAVSYMGETYFINKVNDVRPEMKEAFEKRDILAELLSLVGVPREAAKDNHNHSGGVQYLFKKTDANFWKKVMNDAILIRTYMQKVNREFFPSQELGYQSWCADMWAILWNLWLRGEEVRVSPALDFSWASDTVDKLQKPIFHNAGIVSENMDGRLNFFKGKYHLGSDPTEDPVLEKIIESDESMKYCTWFYAVKLKQLKEKYKLKY